MVEPRKQTYLSELLRLHEGTLNYGHKLRFDSLLVIIYFLKPFQLLESSSVFSYLATQSTARLSAAGSL